MARTEYPEKWKRERMLWFIYEWLQANVTDEDPMPHLMVNDVSNWGSEQEGMNGAQAMHLFKQLVEEGYIALSSFDTHLDGFPWAIAFPQSLTTKGLLEIGELPDQNSRLLGSLTAIEEAIVNLNIPENQKTTAMKAADELKDFLRQLPREAAVEVAKAAIVGIAV